jgi:mono/diheme cytochrome c family protein
MDMQDQPKYKVYRSSNFFKDGLSSRPLPEGAVARGQLRADAALYTGKIDKAQAGQSASGGQTTQGQQNQDGRGMGQPAQGQSGGANSGGGSGTNTGGAGANIYEGDVDAFPFPITEEVVNRGQERYQIFCSICHGMSGYGDGMIVRRGFRKPSSYYEDNLRKAPVGHYYDVITNGWGSMPNYAAQIPVQDRWAIVAYIRALQLTVPPGPPNGNTGAPQTTPQQQSQSQSQPSQPQPAASQTPKTGGQR